MLLSFRESIENYSRAMRKTVFITTIIIAAMIGFKTIGQENLVTEDGKVAAQALSLDKETSKIAYETATFGIG